MKPIGGNYKQTWRYGRQVFQTPGAEWFYTFQSSDETQRDPVS